MLSQNLVHSLDMAAAHGILDYDGAAFITGTKPRYMGSPEFTLATPQLTGTNLQQAQKDEVIRQQSEEHTFKNPLWKKLLFGVIVVGLGVLGLSKLKNKPDFLKISSLKECFVKGIDYIKDGWNKLFKGKFSKM